MNILSFEWRVFFKELYSKFFETDVMSASAQVAFYFSFAFFPLLLFLVSLFGLVLESTDELRGEMYGYLGQLLPPSAYELVRTTMDEIIETSSGGKLTLGLLVTLWSASAGIDSLRIALNRVYEVKETRSWWNTKVHALVLTFLFILLLAIGLAAVTAGSSLVKVALTSMGLEVSSPWVVSLIQWGAIVIVMTFSTAVVYSWLPSFKEFHWVWISPGSATAILIWIVFGSLFRLYLQYFNSYNKAYGSLGAVIILMLWMYITGLALLTGGAINSVLTEMSEKHVIDAEDPMNPD
ncbi:MAG TPA: YihY/virulence factor BrkB family protein [Pyrinomonadaceae bacterium]|nr:YihY/virulence factor BrkB family protein [Pyrinomonadaceae bacterium]